MATGKRSTEKSEFEEGFELATSATPVEWCTELLQHLHQWKYLVSFRSCLLSVLRRFMVILAELSTGWDEEYKAFIQDKNFRQKMKSIDLFRIILTANKFIFFQILALVYT